MMNPMAIAAGINAVSSLASAYSQSEALKTQGKFQRQQMEFNARIARIQAADALKRGEFGASAVRRKAKQVQGAQRAATAAQNIVVDEGTALDLQNETADMAELDIMTIRNNAWREAWGYEVQAGNLQSQGRFAEMSSEFEAKSTLLTGGLKALSYGMEAYAYSKAESKKPEPKKPEGPSSKGPGSSGKTGHFGTWTTLSGKTPTGNEGLLYRAPNVGESWRESWFKDGVGW